MAKKTLPKKKVAAPPPKKAKKPKGKKDKSKVLKTDHDRMLRRVPLGQALPNLTKMRSELLDMTDVLMGREEPPINAGHLTLMEVADAYFARAAEMTMLIQGREREGLIKVGRGKDADPLHKFRTGELRTFMEMAKRAADLGSRRLTKEQLVFEQSRLGRETERTDY